MAFNIGGGMSRSLSLIELFNMLEKLTEAKLTYIMKSPRLSDQKVFVANCRAAEEIFQWKAKTSAEEGIRMALNFINKN